MLLPTDNERLDSDPVVVMRGTRIVSLPPGFSSGSDYQSKFSEQNPEREGCYRRSHRHWTSIDRCRLEIFSRGCAEESLPLLRATKYVQLIVLDLTVFNPLYTLDAHRKVPFGQALHEFPSYPKGNFPSKWIM